MAEIIDFSKVKSGQKPLTDKPVDVKPNTEAQKLNFDPAFMLAALQVFKRKHEQIYKIDNAMWAAFFQLQTAMHTLGAHPDAVTCAADPETSSQVVENMTKAVMTSVDTVLKNSKVQAYL